MPRPPVQVHSFDVFDTVLTRSVGAPSAVFLLVGRRLAAAGALDVEPTVFAAVREQAEGRAAAHLGVEPTFAQIYREVAAALSWRPEAVAAAQEIELDVEREVSRALPGAADRLAAARATGPVVFVSDTPLPGTVVRELLENAGLLGPQDRVYASSDHGVTKQQGGELFPVVLADLGVPAGAVEHTGDNLVSDVAEARLHGLRATHAPAGSLNRYEQLLESEALVSSGLSSALAGASRLGRLDAVREGIDPTMAATAAGVTAPLLVAYSVWLVEQAQQLGLRRLYFVARDAEVILQVFRPVAAALGADIEAHYLYGSRAAWDRAVAIAGPEDVRTRVQHSPTVRDALFRLGITLEEATAFGVRLPPGGTVDDPLSERGLAALVETVAGGLGLERVREVAQERLTLLLAYLRQEGLGEDGSSAGLVDVGWVGRMFGALDAVMDVGGMPRVGAFFYVGRLAGARRVASADPLDRQRAWLFDQIDGVGKRQPSGIEVVVEAMLTGTEGSLTGYRQVGEKVEPVLLRPDNAGPLAWGLADLRRTVDLTVARLLATDGVLAARGDLRGAVQKVVEALWLRPTPAEVELWGGMPTDSTLDHAGSTHLAVRVTSPAVVAQLRVGRLQLRPVTTWRAGTAAVSPSPWRHLLRGVAWYDQHGGRLKRIPHRLALELATRRNAR